MALDQHTILLVDDDDVEREEVQRWIGYDYEIFEATTRKEALEMVQNEGFSCALIDYRLPDGNGLQLIPQITARDIPAIMLTRRGGARIAVEAMKAGCKDYLLKDDLTKEALVRTIQYVLEKSDLERKLYATESRLHEAMTAANVGIWDWNVRTNEVYVSPQLTAQLGYPPDETWTGFADWQQALHPDDYAQAQEKVRAYLAGETPEYLSVFRLRHRDGTYRWILSRGHASRDENNEPTRFIGVHIDITQRKQQEEELAAARKIQKRMLPGSSPQIPGLDIAAQLIPAAATAGDLYDFLMFPDGCLGLIVGDVTGHGLGPSLIMAAARQALQVLKKYHSDPEELALALNDALIADTDGPTFVTMFMAKIDIEKRMLEYIGAGHQAYLVEPDGTAVCLPSSGIPLGLYEMPFDQDRPPIQMAPGQILALYTDGINEAKPRGGTHFGNDAVMSVIRAHREESAETILNAILDEVKSHSGTPTPEDDMTIIICKVDSSVVQAGEN